MSTPLRPPGGAWSPKGIAAVIDTNVFVSAWLGSADSLRAPAMIVRGAGAFFDSFTSPAILAEVEAVLARPRFGVPIQSTRIWLDEFSRHSRQVDPSLVPGDFAAAVGGDYKDVPVLRTALAVGLYEDGQRAVAAAREAFGLFIVSADRDFVSGRNVWGWRFVRPNEFWGLLRTAR